jgi:hypothetical protein
MINMKTFDGNIINISHFNIMRRMVLLASLASLSHVYIKTEKTK